MNALVGDVGLPATSETVPPGTHRRSGNEVESGLRSYVLPPRVAGSSRSRVISWTKLLYMPIVMVLVNPLEGDGAPEYMSLICRDPTGPSTNVVAQKRLNIVVMLAS